MNFSNTPQKMEFLAFTLGLEEYCIDMHKVQELHRLVNVMRVADKPPFIKGVVNLRGSRVPVIEICGKFNLRTPTYSEATVVMILNMGGSVIGLIVDSVSDIVTFTADQIKPAPAMGRTLSEEYLIGLGATEDRLLTLVDIEKLVSADDIGLVERLVA